MRLVQQVRKEIQVQLVRQVILERLVRLAQQVPQVQQALPQNMVGQVIAYGSKTPMVLGGLIPTYVVRLAQLALRAIQVRKVHKVIQALLAQQDRKASKAHKVTKVLQDQLAQQVRLAQLDQQGHRDRLAQQALLVLKVPQALPQHTNGQAILLGSTTALLGVLTLTFVVPQARRGRRVLQGQLEHLRVILTVKLPTRVASLSGKTEPTFPQTTQSQTDTTRCLQVR